MKKYDLVLFGVKETTALLAQYLHEQGIKIDALVSIAPQVAERNDIANYQDLELTAKMIAADYYCVPDYSLKNLEDDFFQRHQFSTGIAYGWQRLIPEDILQRFAVGVFGFHASPGFLPQGKGRSPLNWALILGEKQLYNHCFKYAVGADAGDIHSIQTFAVNAHDTILTLMYKSLIAAKIQTMKLLQDIQNNQLVLQAQQGESSFFPKRTPEDGFIDFQNSSTQDIVNLIRAVTQPFAGAFCYTAEGLRLTIWEAWPFDALLDFSAYQVGEVIEVLYEMPIVKTRDGSIILHHYEGALLQAHDCLFHSQVREGN